MPRPNFETRLVRLVHTLNHLAAYQTVRLYKEPGILIDFDEAFKFTNLRLRNSMGLKTIPPVPTKVLPQKEFAYGVLTPLEIYNTIWKYHPKGSVMGRALRFKTADEC